MSTRPFFISSLGLPQRIHRGLDDIEDRSRRDHKQKAYKAICHMSDCHRAILVRARDESKDPVDKVEEGRSEHQQQEWVDDGYRKLVYQRLHREYKG